MTNSCVETSVDRTKFKVEVEEGQPCNVLERFRIKDTDISPLIKLVCRLCNNLLNLFRYLRLRIRCFVRVLTVKHFMIIIPVWLQMCRSP